MNCIYAQLMLLSGVTPLDLKLYFLFCTLPLMFDVECSIRGNVNDFTSDLYAKSSVLLDAIRQAPYLGNHLFRRIILLDITFGLYLAFYLGVAVSKQILVPSSLATSSIFDLVPVSRKNVSSTSPKPK